MTPLRSWFSAPGKMTALFLVVAAASAVALVWTGVRLFRQDRALEAQQLEDRREAAAERAVAALEQAVSAEERRLANPQLASLPDHQDAVFLVVGPEGIRVWPEQALPYYPAMPLFREAPAHLYGTAERLEFLSRDYEGCL